jgi:Domain of unknown function (DUF4203)
MGAQELTAALPGGPLAWALAGGVLLLAGRRLFWLVLAVAGFLAGALFALQLLKGQAPWLVLALGLVTGLVAAGIAVFLPRAAAVVAGFFAGGYAGLWLAPHLGLTALPPWLPFAVAGVVAGAAALWLLDWALIAATSVLGAVLVVQALDLHPAPALLALLALTALGLLVQLRTRRRPRRALA